MVWTAARGSTPEGHRDQKHESKLVGLDSAGLATASKCTECHQFEPSLTHPVNVYASMAPSASLPLQSGLITCLTCHDADTEHGSGLRKVGIRGGNSAALCVQCHTADAGSQTSHALLSARAHIKSDNSTQMSVQAGLDFESQNCMSCHDGAVAGGAVSHTMQLTDFQGSAEHPIGVPLQATDRTKNGDFRIASATMLDRRIRLSGGNLSCTSCHSLYSKEPAKLVMSNEGSKLCLSCHTR